MNIAEKNPPISPFEKGGKSAVGRQGDLSGGMKSLCAAVLMALSSFSSSYASIIEPWRHDVSPAATPRAGHSIGASLLLADDYFEAPFKIFYGISDEAELSTRWGIIHSAGNTGISDLKFSVKYNFTKMTSEVPAVFVEGGVSLPTADHTKGLGTGGVGLAAGWYILKEMKPLNIFAGLAGEFNDRDVLVGARPPRVFSYKAGARYDYSKDIVLTGEFKGFNNYWKDPVGFRQEIYLAPGIHYSGTFPVSGSILIGLGRESRKFAIYVEKNF